MNLSVSSVAAFEPLPRVVRVTVFDSMAAAEVAWRALEGGDTLMTPYQRFDFLALWQRHIGEPAGVVPFIVVGFDAADKPLCLWPLGCRRAGPFKVVEFLGGSHVNFNMPLWRGDALAQLDEGVLRDLLSRLGDRADAIVLKQQPFSWQGTRNPLALLPHAASANSGYRGALLPDFDALLGQRTRSDTRKKMRKKERALAEHGPVRFARMQTPAEIKSGLDSFFEQKAARMRERGIPDVFSENEVREFIVAGVRGGAIELYVLSVGDTILATFGGIVGAGDRFCGMFNSMIVGRFRNESPGEQLLLHLVRHCCERGLATFDLGAGTASYKGLFCPDQEEMFDSFLPLTPAGKLIALVAQTTGGIKRVIKHNPMLWSAVETARRIRLRMAKP